MFREYLASRPMTVADVVAAADVPQSSAMRWLAALVGGGIVELLDNELVTLTPEGVARLNGYIEHLQSKALMRVV
jgi:DNA-binding IclR family transcriptional regulator